MINPFKYINAFTQNDRQLPSWKNLVEYARWCPTVHNLQPHKLRIISNTEAELYYDPSRLLPVGDPNAIFTTIAMGIFLEHLSIVANSYGARVDISQLYEPITTDSKTTTLFAKLKLSLSEEKETIDKEFILRRRTSRLHYDGIPLKNTTSQKLAREAEKFSHSFSTSTDQELIDFIISLNQQTLFEDLESKADRDELNHLFRYTQEEAEKHKDGLWAKCMGFPGSLMKSVFVHHERWEKGIRKKLLGKYYKTSFKGTTTMCWFAGAFGDTKDWLHAGRMLARNWLLLTMDGAYIQPFGSLITNMKAYEKIKNKLPKPIAGRDIWMIFRAGYSPEPVRSYRLSTEEIIIE